MTECDALSKTLNQLQEQVLNLLDDLLSICPYEPDILMVRLFFESKVTPEKLMEGFVEWVYPWKIQIAERNDDYFNKNDHVFGPLPPEKVKHFKIKWNDGTFDEEDKYVIWDYFDVFISLIEQYNKTK